MERNLDSIVLQALQAVSLARWNRLRELEDLLQHYPRHLARGLIPANQELLTSSDWAPLVDISETPKACLIKAGLAGIRREQIKVKLVHGVLTLRGERRMGKPGKDPKHRCVQRFYGSFARSFTLPEDGDADADAEYSKAAFSEGLLTLSLPKMTVKPTHSRDIEIR